MKTSCGILLLLLALAVPPGSLAAGPEPGPSIDSPLITTNGVIFSYADPDAFSVSIAGNFNEWSINSHLLERNDKGIWTITVPLKPGKYEYQFNINGIYWKHDPNNTNRITGSYGGLKSIVVVPDTMTPSAALTNSAAAANEASQLREVKFTYTGPPAKSVAVGGYFNRWDPAANPMTRDDNGTWTAVVSLKPGNYPYKFRVDGQWMPDPANPSRVPDGHGGNSSVVSVEP